jgi:hypothetical protein
MRKEAKTIIIFDAILLCPKFIVSIRQKIWIKISLQSNILNYHGFRLLHQDYAILNILLLIFWKQFEYKFIQRWSWDRCYFPLKKTKWPTTDFRFYNIKKHQRLLLFEVGSLVHSFSVTFDQNKEFWSHLKIGISYFLTKITIFLFNDISLINLIENSAFLSGIRKSAMFLRRSAVDILIVKVDLLNARQFRLFEYSERLDCHPR